MLHDTSGTDHHKRLLTAGAAVKALNARRGDRIRRKGGSSRGTGIVPPLMARTEQGFGKAEAGLLMNGFIKYPRTRHLEGSRLQPGDIDDGCPLRDLPDGEKVWEEKLDGANSGISFDADANMILQSRGHVLSGGPRERQFDVFKSWAAAHEDALFDILGTRYVMFTEFMGAKHSIFYDDLPHLVFEEDIYDREERQFLSTDRRHALLDGGPVPSVPVIRRGEVGKVREIEAMIGPSSYVTRDWRSNLRLAAERAGSDPELEIARTDATGHAEGVYLKVEADGHVVGRFKWVRPSFLQTILDSDSHWLARPIVPNRLAAGVDIYTPVPAFHYSP